LFIYLFIYLTINLKLPKFSIIVRDWLLINLKSYPFEDPELKIKMDCLEFFNARKYHIELFLGLKRSHVSVQVKMFNSIWLQHQTLINV